MERGTPGVGRVRGLCLLVRLDGQDLLPSSASRGRHEGPSPVVCPHAQASRGLSSLEPTSPCFLLWPLERAFIYRLLNGIQISYSWDIDWNKKQNDNSN